MIKKIGRKNYRVYAFDFETHNDEESIAKNTSGVWLGSIIDEKSKVTDEDIFFYSIEGFFKKLEELTSFKRHDSHEKRPTNNILLYAYNLSFEWSFILPYLKKYGFTWKEKIEKEDFFSRNYSSITTHSCSSVWTATITLGNGFLVKFRDLAKIYGGGLGNLAESMGLEVKKGEIDYRLNRLHDYKVTKEEKEYNFNDNKIVMEVLEKVKDDETFWKVVSVSSYACKEMINFGYPKAKNKMKAYRKDYPVPPKEEYDFLRKTVAGGITYAPERWQFKIAKNVKHIDAHQMHPTQAYFHLFPYGKGVYKKGKPTNTFTRICACHIRISYTGVKLHSVIKNIGINAIENAQLWVWSFEIPTMKKCYENLEIEYIDYYEYKTRFLPWRDFYRENYDKRVIARAKKDNYNVMRYKLLNNGSYGKLLERAHVISFENTIDQYGIITSINHEKEDNVDLGSTYTNLAVGSCIPAYSRVCLIETALKFGYKNIVYFDTDSIFYVDNKETREAVKTVKFGDALGTWAFEPDIKRMQVSAPKRYKMELVGQKEIEVKMAGVNGLKTKFEIDDETRFVPFEEINIISEKYQVKQAYRCKNGTLIKFTEKEISVQNKYKGVYEQNVLQVGHQTL